MKIIKDIVSMIDDELEGAEHYIKFALQYKESHPTLAGVFYEISTQEMRHVNMLHDEVTKIIKMYRDKHGEPPAAMVAVYDWEHEKSIEEAKEIKIMQAQYRDGI